MDEKLSKLLKELYELDPSLKQHDSLLRTVLGEVLAARPEAQMDPAFYRDLRETLLSRIRETTSDSSETTPRFSFFNRLGYAFAGLAVVTGVAVLANGVAPSEGFGVTQVDPNSFGTLKIDTQGEKGGLGGGGELDTMMYYPEDRINYVFNYTGNKLDLDGTVDVLKRVPSKGGIGFDFDLDALDVDALGDLEVTYTNFEPTGDEGYSLSYDPNQQTVYLSEYHVSTEDCPWGYCNSWDTTPLTGDEIPTEEELIAVSDAFLKEMGISQNLVGEPYSLLPLDELGGEVNYTLTVSYPFEIDGTPVYYNWGSRAGMNVDIDVHRMKVIHVNWIYTSEQFASSAYPAATAEEVLAAAETGGDASAQWDDPTEVIELDLGSPTLVYSQIQTYSDSGTYTDLYVPAYAFPILNDTEDLYYGDSIVVPLAEELMQSAPPMILY